MTLQQKIAEYLAQKAKKAVKNSLYSDGRQRAFDNKLNSDVFIKIGESEGEFDKYKNDPTLI